MYEHKVPEYIEKRIDIKYATIITAGLTIKSLKENGSLSSSHELIILTSIGMVTGDIVSSNPESSDETSTNQAFFILRNNLLDEKTDSLANPIVVNNSSVIMLKNAKIKAYDGSFTSSLDMLNLYSDQIIGFSYGVFN